MYSRCGIWIILASYLCVIAVAMVVDYIIATVSGTVGFDVPTNVFFGLLVAVWYLLNEFCPSLKTRAEWARLSLNGCVNT